MHNKTYSKYSVLSSEKLSPDFEGCQTEQGAEQGGYPEADDDAAVGNSLLFVMVVQRSHQEKTLAFGVTVIFLLDE